jgi:hypothetical protein
VTRGGVPLVPDVALARFTDGADTVAEHARRTVAPGGRVSFTMTAVVPQPTAAPRVSRCPA